MITWIPLSEGEAHIQDDDVGLQLLDLRDSQASLAALADQLQVRALLDRPHDALTVEGVVVGDEHPDPRVPRAHFGVLSNLASAGYVPLARLAGRRR